MSKINIVMDMSQYDLFLLCPYKYKIRHKLNLSPAGKKAESLDRGTLIHLACEVYYQSLKDKLSYANAVDNALLKMKIAFGTESDLDNDEANHLLNTMEQYFDHWRVVDQSLEILGVEEPFIYLLHEDDEVKIYMAGKIDLRVRNEKYDNIVYDHKSFSRSGPVNELSNQFKNYCTATGTRELIVDKIGLQKSLKPSEKFLRPPLSYDHLILESWKRNVVYQIKHNYLSCEMEDYWPTNETGCYAFNRQCENYEVCKSSGQEAKDFKLMSNYIKVESWDVSKALMKPSELLEKK